MITANFVLLKQIHYLQNKHLGFEKEDVIYYSAPSGNTYDRQMVIKQELLRNPAISSVFMSSSQPGDGALPGRFLPEGSKEQDAIAIANISIDENYLPSLQVPLLAGRNFSTAIAGDTAVGCWWLAVGC